MSTFIASEVYLMKQKDSELLQHRLMLHIAVVLFGFTAILGKQISIDAIPLVFWRMVLSLALILGLRSMARISFGHLDKKQKLIFLGIGLLIGIHWFCFYASVKMAHVSVALICMALTPMFTSLIEPIINKSRIDRADILFSLFTVPLVYLLIGGIIGFNIAGFIMGILAAFFASIFSIMNKKFVGVTDNNTLMVYEFSGVLLISTCVMYIFYGPHDLADWFPYRISDWIYLLLLSWICTNVAFKLTVQAMKKISVFETNLIIGLEPLYGILLAVFFFKEHQYFTLQFYVAAILILALVLIYPLKRQNRNV